VHKKNLAATTQKVYLTACNFQNFTWRARPSLAIKTNAKSPCARKCCGKIACAQFL